MREGGRFARSAHDAPIEVSADIPISVVFVPPTSKDDETFQEASNAFQSLNVLTVPYSEAGRVAEQAAGGLANTS